MRSWSLRPGVYRTYAPVFLALVSLTLAACGRTGSANTATAAAPAAHPDIIPVSALQTQLAQRPTVLLFMATGCSSCAVEVNQLQQAMAGHAQVQAIGVDIVSADSPVGLRSFLEDQDVAAAPLRWVIDSDGSVVSRYGVAMLGATVGIDRHGVVRFQNLGPSDAGQLRDQIAALVKA